MRKILTALLATACVAALPAAGVAQTRKPAPKPAAKPAVKPAPRPAAKPATAPRTAAAAPRASAPAPTPVPAPSAKAMGDNAFNVGTSVVNIGLGLGSRYSYALGGFGGTSSVLPALSVSYERGIIPLGPGVLGVGASSAISRPVTNIRALKTGTPT